MVDPGRFLTFEEAEWEHENSWHMNLPLNAPPAVRLACEYAESRGAVVSYQEITEYYCNYRRVEIEREIFVPQKDLPQDVAFTMHMAGFVDFGSAWVWRFPYAH